MSELPRLVAFMVRLGVRRPWREALLGDLEEGLHADLEAGLPENQARRRAVREALRSTFDALRPSADRPPPPAERSERRPGDPPVTAFLTDLRFAVRGLRRAPAFTLVVAVTLALGIGCVTAFASLFDAVLLQPLPFPEPERLVQLWGESTEAPGGRSNSSYPDYRDFKDGTGAFESLSVYQANFANLVEAGTTPERVPTSYISHDFLDTLGLTMTLGRDFAGGDDQPGAEPTVVIGADLWHRRFGGERSVLGRTLRIDDTPRTVIGVAPAGLTLPAASDLWLPVTSLSGFDVRGVHSLRVIGRLGPGAELARAGQELSAVAARLRQQYPQSNAQRGVRLEPLHDSLVGPARPRLILVAAAACVLLLVVCANISSLLLERTTRRRRELATRAALGASHGQLMRYFLAEALLLVSLGVAGGLAVAAAARTLLVTYGPELPRSVDGRLDPRALGFAVAVTALVGLIFVLVPSLHALGRGLFRRLRVGDIGTAGRRDSRWRSAFVVTQVALAVVLTLGAALLVQSLDRLYDVELGFDSEGVLTADMEVPTPYVSEQWPATVAFYEGLIESLEAMPGVVRAAAAHQHPASPGWSTSFKVFGQPEPPPGLSPEANFRPVTDGYFETAGIPLLKGRLFDRERSGAPGQMVVNQAFVDVYLEGGDAIGQRILRNSWWIEQITEYEIIGVVADSRFAGRHLPPQPAMYLPHRQDVPPSMTVLLRVEQGLDPLAFAPALREAVWALDGEMPIGRLSSLEELVRDTVSVRRFLTFLLTAFAAVTLGLAALGLYGALAYTTARRTRELGLRMALGARVGQLRTMVLSQGLRLTALGVGVGLAGAWLATRTLEALLFEVEPGDPATFAGVTLLLAGVAFAAGWLPAWRATRVDPCRALADE